MAKSGIQRIDDLFEDAPGAKPIRPGDSDREAAGIVQDLLIGHGHPELPGLMEPDRGVFGPKTSAAVRDFRANYGLDDADSVDGLALRKMVAVTPPDPLASRGYLTLALNFPFDSSTQILAITAVMEGHGKFTAMNRNTDQAGLSFGILQWAQKSGRLAEILLAFEQASSGEFIRIFGAGAAATAHGLLAHTQKPNGGVDRNTGQTIDPDFDLVSELWTSRFREAGRSSVFQPAQIRTALAAFRAFHAKLQVFAPELRSQRSVAFMADLANQHGAAGAQSIYNAVKQPGMAEPQLLNSAAEESVNRVPDQFKKATRTRRKLFLTTPLLTA